MTSYGPGQNYPLTGYPQPAPGYPPPNPGYPQPGEGYPSAGYPPPNAGYPPPNAGYPPPNAGYPPPNAGYPPPNAGYPPPNTGYPPPNAGYPPPNAGYPPPTSDYLPPNTSYPPANSGYAPQPGGQMSEWIQAPLMPVNCPPGLEYLTQIDQLLVKQKVELLEAFTGFETANKYTIKNSMGQKVYYAAEDTDCCTRLCCGPTRPFDMKILDNNGQEVMHFYRPLRCQSCWCFCCLQTLEVMAPPGKVIGSVKQNWSILTPTFDINNAAGECVLKIEGPICTWSICGDVEFKVLSRDGSSEVGQIRKQWTGLLKEAFTDADNFGITFPMDLDVNIKATLLGALFLIDFMFFEKKNNKESDGIGMF